MKNFCFYMNPLLYISACSCVGPCKTINSPVDMRFVNNFPPCIADADGYLISNSIKEKGTNDIKNYIKTLLIFFIFYDFMKFKSLHFSLFRYFIIKWMWRHRDIKRRKSIRPFRIQWSSQEIRAALSQFEDIEILSQYG